MRLICHLSGWEAHCSLSNPLVTDDMFNAIKKMLSTRSPSEFMHLTPKIASGEAKAIATHLIQAFQHPHPVWPQSTYVEAITECNQAKPQFKSIKCMDVRGLWRTWATRKLLLSSENFQSLFTQQVCNPATEQAVIWSGTLKTCGASRCDSTACLWWLCHDCFSSEYTMRFCHFLA